MSPLTNVVMICLTIGIILNACYFKYQRLKQGNQPNNFWKIISIVSIIQSIYKKSFKIFPININSFKIMLGKKRQKSTGVICLALQSFLFLQSSLLPVKLLARNTKSYSLCRQNLRHVSFSFFKISCLVCQESIRLKSKNHSKLHLN